MQLLLPTTYHHSRRSSKTRSVRTPAVSRATAVEPLWTKPSLFFYLPCGLFWLTILLTYVTEQHHQHAPYVQLQHRHQQQQQHVSNGGQDSTQEQDSLAGVVPCNPTHRPLATCAHRGNAAELLAKEPGAPATATVLQQMQLLWAAGVTCFDMDVVQLKGGDMIVGHPSDLAAQVDASALPTGSSNSSSREAEGAASTLPPEQLQSFTLQQLRAAGVTADAAPTLQALLAAFTQLLDSTQRNNTTTSSSRSGSSSDQPSQSGTPAASALSPSSVQEAAVGRLWAGVPLISLEPKFAAATDAQAFISVAEVAAAAGVANHTVLWLRQMPHVGASGSNSTSGAVIVTEFAKALKHSLDSMARKNATSSSSSSSVIRQQSHQRPLLGLIVTDMLLQQPHLAALQSQGDASASLLTATLLDTAGGVLETAGREEGAALVLDAFDVLAPSIKLPARVLHALLQMKPCLAWTLESESHTRKAMRLGLDVAITNTPMAQLAVVDREEKTLCNSRD